MLRKFRPRPPQNGKKSIRCANDCQRLEWRGFAQLVYPRVKTTVRSPAGGGNLPRSVCLHINLFIYPTQTRLLDLRYDSYYYLTPKISLSVFRMNKSLDKYPLEKVKNVAFKHATVTRRSLRRRPGYTPKVWRQDENPATYRIPCSSSFPKRLF